MFKGNLTEAEIRHGSYLTDNYEITFLCGYCHAPYVRGEHTCNEYAAYCLVHGIPDTYSIHARIKYYKNEIQITLP